MHCASLAGGFSWPATSVNVQCSYLLLCSQRCFYSWSQIHGGKNRSGSVNRKRVREWNVEGGYILYKQNVWKRLRTRLLFAAALKVDIQSCDTILASWHSVEMHKYNHSILFVMLYLDCVRNFFKKFKWWIMSSEFAALDATLSMRRIRHLSVMMQNGNELSRLRFVRYWKWWMHEWELIPMAKFNIFWKAIQEDWRLLEQQAHVFFFFPFLFFIWAHMAAVLLLSAWWTHSWNCISCL